MAFDYELVARELLTAFRGSRSQVAWSRRLGYKSNVAYSWESGRRYPTAAETFRAASRNHIDVEAALEQFYGVRQPWMDEVDVTSPEGVARLMDDLRGSLSISELARSAELSRYSVTRWLSAQTQPRLPDFLRLVEAASVRMVDLISVFVDPMDLESTRPVWEQMEARRRGARELPWTQAVLRALDLRDYEALPAHEPGWIALWLGISPEEETRCLESLKASGLIRWDGTRYEPVQIAVDTTSRDRSLGQHLKAHWSGVARDRILADTPGQFSYNVFTVSREDFERIRELHLKYFRALRAIVAESEPLDVVAVANVQLFSLEAGHSENE